MNPEPCFQFGPGDFVDADYMAPCPLVAKSSPFVGLKKKKEIPPADEGV